MKLIIIVNHGTDTFETCLPSRDLSSEELTHIYEMMGHGTERTVHYVECGEKAIPFMDIVQILTEVAEDPQVAVAHRRGEVDLLPGLPIKFQGK